MPPTIVYLHGLNSAPASIKARALGAAIAKLPADGRPEYFIPQLHHRPAEAVRAVEGWLDSRSRTALAFIGSSLGGFYATYFAERREARAILINPSVRPHADLERYLGPQRNVYTGETYELTREHFDELRRFRIGRITRPERYFLLTQSGDEVLDWREAVDYFGGALQFLYGGGDHAFQDFDAQIPAILRFASEVPA
ncbi:MAG: YqiA/YcfP family alpha/beta fold hydrolase [Casimicrobiaceae bacterium]